MATGTLSIKLRCASWQQLATIYKRDLSKGTMFLKASSPPAVGTVVKIDLTLPSASVIVLTGVVEQHVTDPQRGAGVELKLAPIPAGSVWLIESALASESKRRNTPATGIPIAAPQATSGPIPAVGDSEDLVAAEQDLIKALLAEAESLRKLNPFLVLGVGYEASDGDVRAAFGDLTKRYHPDLFARYESSELRQVAAEIFILIRDAYRRLGDERGRTQALAALGRTAAPRAVPNRAPVPPPVAIAPPPKRVSTGQQQPPLPRPPEAITPRAATEPPRPLTDMATTVRPGESSGVPTPSPSAHRSGPIPTPPTPTPTVLRPPAASQPLKRIPADPPPIQTDRKPVMASPPPVLTEVADGSLLEELIDAGKLDEAVAAYKVMAKKHPADRSFRAGVELCEGLRALTQRDRMEAAQRFEAALEIDPSNERAARELADMRRQATNERKGLLTRLMGKKE